MREFPLNLTEYPQKGLRKFSENKNNTPGLIECFNLQLNETGLIPLKTISALFSEGPNILRNHDFDGDLSDWTNSGNWTYVGDHAHSSGGTGALTQTFNTDDMLIEGQTYNYEIETKNYVSGTLLLIVGGTTAISITDEDEYTGTVIAGSSGIVSLGSLAYSGDVQSVSIKSVRIPLNSGHTPTLFRGKSITLMCYKDMIFQVDESDWSFSHIKTYDAQDITTEKVITSGEDWHFIDMYDAWYLLNGTDIVFQTNMPLMLNQTNKVFVEDLAIKSGCEFKGRVVIGGLPSSIWSSSLWQILWDNWEDEIPQEYALNNDDMGGNYVFWSSIGEGILWLIYPDIVVRGLIPKERVIDKARIFEMIEKNDFGWMPLPTQKDIIHMKPLGHSIVAYGEEGIWALTPVIKPLNTFGMKRVSSTGISQRNQVGGSEDIHLFFDELGEGWLMGGDLEPKKIGYKEFFSEISSGDMLIRYEETDKVFYVSDKGGTKGFCVSPFGTTESKYNIVTFLDYIDGDLKGIYAEEEDVESRIVTDIFDMGMRGIKHIKEVELGIFTTSATVQVAIDYRHQKSESFTTSSWVNVNHEGIGYIRVTGAEFRVRIKTSNYTDIQLSDIGIRWNSIDKRNVRGARNAR